MAEQGDITEAMAKVALSTPAQVVREKGSGSINYAADYVMDMLDDTVGAIDQDIVVTTTLDPRMQADAERALTYGAVQKAGDFRQLHIYSKMGGSLEEASDALKWAGLIARDYLLGNVLRA